MFDFDDIREIGSAMRKNKLRTFLTGFSVAWGIFMLICLLAAGNGLRHGIELSFSEWSVNTVMVSPGYTNMPYKGMPTNRMIVLTSTELESVQRDNPEIDLITPFVMRNDTISYGEEFLTGQIQSVYPACKEIIKREILANNGRFINETDLRQKRKVIVLSPQMAKVLFRDSKSPLGQFVKLGNIMFQVIGVYKSDNNNDNPPAYIPFTTGQTLFADGNKLNSMSFTINGVNSKEASDDFEKRFRSNLARHLRFNPDDKNAVNIYNMGNEFRMLQSMNTGISLFIWIIGIGTLMAGIVGVSNIMLISVRERTREFGIRKAIGAKPASILRLIIFESLLVTAVFGYVGMIAGIGLSEAINYIMELSPTAAPASGQPGNAFIFRNPTVDLRIAFSATCVLVIAGVLAGYFPARKAVNISPVEAMKED